MHVLSCGIKQVVPNNQITALDRNLLVIWCPNTFTDVNAYVAFVPAHRMHVGMVNCVQRCNLGYSFHSVGAMGYDGASKVDNRDTWSFLVVGH